MSNPYYNASGTPSTGSAGNSAPIRAEYALIAAGFALLPQLTGGTAANLTFPSGTDTLVGRATTDTLTNKTLSSPTISGTVAGSPTLSGAWALGTPASVTLTNATGLPVSTGISGLGTGVAAALAQAVSGSGGIVLATSPTLVTPALGIPSAAVLTNATGLPVSTGLAGAGTGVVAALGAAVTGSGGIVLATSPTLASPILTTPNIGTPSAATLTNATGLPLTTGVTGVLPVANGGTNANTAGATAANNIGALAIASNLGDLNSASTARTNLGLGSAALKTASGSGSTVASVTGSFTVGNFASFSDTSGTIQDSGVNATTNWSTGDVKTTLKTTADIGWVMMNDGTIGDASSGGTTRANADTSALFTLLWNNTTNANCAVSGGRGASAAADFAAHKTIALPKMLGRALASAGAGSGLTSRALAAALGEETHLLTTGEIPSITPTATSSVTDPGHVHGPGTLATGNNVLIGVAGTGPGNTGGSSTSVVPIVSGTTASATTSITVSTTVNSFGGGGSHDNMQPSSFINFMIKL